MGTEEEQELRGLTAELREIGNRFARRRNVEDTLTDCERFEEILSEVSDYGGGVGESMGEPYRILVGVIKETVPKIVTAAYENAQQKVSGAKTIEDKMSAVSDALGSLQAFVEYCEYADHPILQKAVGALLEYDSKLGRAYAEERASREEEEFREATRGITYTATEKQVRYLIALGANPRDLNGINKQQASAMISHLTGERPRGSKR